MLCAPVPSAAAFNRAMSANEHHGTAKSRLMHPKWPMLSVSDCSFSQSRRGESRAMGLID
jgi:hypothetical protein